MYVFIVYVLTKTYTLEKGKTFVKETSQVEKITKFMGINFLERLSFKGKETIADYKLKESIILRELK